MADKSPGKSLRKPALSIKERRAAKRAKVVESTPMVRKRKRRPDRRFVSRVYHECDKSADNRLLPVWARPFSWRVGYRA